MAEDIVQDRNQQYCCKQFEYCIGEEFIRKERDRTFSAWFTDEIWVEDEEGNQELINGQENNSQGLTIFFCPFCGKKIIFDKLKK